MHKTGEKTKRPLPNQVSTLYQQLVLQRVCSQRSRSISGFRTTFRFIGIPLCVMEYLVATLQMIPIWAEKACQRPTWKARAIDVFDWYAEWIWRLGECVREKERFYSGVNEWGIHKDQYGLWPYIHTDMSKCAVVIFHVASSAEPFVVLCYGN